MYERGAGIREARRSATRETRVRFPAVAVHIHLDEHGKVLPHRSPHVLNDLNWKAEPIGNDSAVPVEEGVVV